MKSTRILIVGCGPAGLLTAMGLHRLGYRPVVVGMPRPHPVTEGISQRVVQALHSSGCHHALATISEPVARTAHWNGETRTANVEYLVDRTRFDKALLLDAQSLGVKLLTARVTKLVQVGGLWRATVQPANPTTGQDTQKLTAEYLVEARGRSAPLAKAEKMRGQESITYYQNWSSQSYTASVNVMTSDNGWLWLADNGKGNTYSQLTTSSSEQLIEGKDDIPALIRKQLTDSEECPTAINSWKPKGAPGARSSTPILSGLAIDDYGIRVGDAAMASDPLSGNGIFMALSSAFIAPAVINTQLGRPKDAELAKAFYQARLHHLFMRFARLGHDFYQQEQRWQDSKFWQTRAQWPDTQPAHVAQDSVQGVTTKPVVNNGWIEAKQVVVTAYNPLGIWKLNGRDAVEQITLKR